MSTWISSHGASAIKTQDTRFSIAATESGSIVQPEDANHLTGSVIFPLPSLPHNASHFVKVAVAFSTHTARVVKVVIMNGTNEVYQKAPLRHTSDFTLQLRGTDYMAEERDKGLALWLTIAFEHVTAMIEFQSVGLEVAMVEKPTFVAEKPMQTIKLDSGLWNTTTVRSSDHSQKTTKGQIEFSTKFTSKPAVIANMTGADVGGGTNFRVRVYTSGVTTHGFTIHADTWGDTHMYSCGVSWMAIGH
ncbi:uncharacterized protein F4822DRAFT_187081 [Hypoxylon trugodes]|uniref:uncharacterized protein n=1 Tax=Hypoxylon trugodes TaxID=326681 RepID=UPI00218E60E1|nr:uncharacterized protein F4822DRAFT_187081 [Hypoxylon trugodes]KAI1391484.1 hypothetical protein F4822DRAFT_187081 [Hypoxylon trugodes]